MDNFLILVQVFQKTECHIGLYVLKTLQSTDTKMLKCLVTILQLRTHLALVHKHQHQQTAINLNNPDSQAMHLETRLVQLDNAINMELWQVRYMYKQI